MNIWYFHFAQCSLQIKLSQWMLSEALEKAFFLFFHPLIKSRQRNSGDESRQRQSPGFFYMPLNFRRHSRSGFCKTAVQVWIQKCDFSSFERDFLQSDLASTQSGPRCHWHEDKDELQNKVSLCSSNGCWVHLVYRKLGVGRLSEPIFKIFIITCIGPFFFKDSPLQLFVQPHNNAADRSLPFFGGLRVMLKGSVNERCALRPFKHSFVLFYTLTPVDTFLLQINLSFIGHLD